LDELVAECFSYNFVERLRSLMAQLRTKPNIDGVVRLNVRHFLYERQRKYDPIGFRVFEMTREAVEAALSAEVLLREGKGPGSSRSSKNSKGSRKNVSNSTILALARSSRHAEAPLASREALAAVARRWNDALLPQLLVAAGRSRQKVVQRLAERIEELPRISILRFRFRDLVDPLKADARIRWADDLSRRGGHDPDAVSLPDLSLEEKESFEWLALQVRASISRLSMDERKRTYLERLWSFFAPTGEASFEGQLSHRALSRRLAIPRERLPDLMSTLREVLSEVRSSRAFQNPQEGS